MPRMGVAYEGDMPSKETPTTLASHPATEPPPSHIKQELPAQDQ